MFPLLPSLLPKFDEIHVSCLGQPSTWSAPLTSPTRTPITSSPWTFTTPAGGGLSTSRTTTSSKWVLWVSDELWVVLSFVLVTHAELPYPSLPLLGEQGAIFASLPEGTIHPSMVHYRPFDAWSSSSQWIYSLPKSEVAVAIAVGGSFTLSSSSSSSRLDEATGFVIVATNKGYLRFLTGSGVQRYLWRLGEDVVSMVGGASTVLVVHREGGTSLDGTPDPRASLGPRMVKPDEREVFVIHRLPEPEIHPHRSRDL